MRIKKSLGFIIRRTIISVMLVYALVFQGLAWSMVAHNLDNTPICVSDATQNKVPEKHEHTQCVLCQAGINQAVIEADILFAKVKLQTPVAIKTVLIAWQTPLIKTLHPPPLKSRAPPITI